MQIYVINPYQTSEPHFPIIGMVGDYHSLIWTTQLYGLGEFEMVLPAISENISLLQEGRFLVRESDIQIVDSVTHYNNAMIIRKVDTSYDPDIGYILTVSGRSTKDILSQRIIWEPIDLDTTLDNAMPYIIRMNASDPVNYLSGFLRMAQQHLYGEEAAEQAAQNTYDDSVTDYNDSVTAYEQAVEDYGEDSQEAKDAKAFMEHNKAYMEECKVALDKAKESVQAAQKVVDYYTWSSGVASKRQIPYFTDQSTPMQDAPEITVHLRGENLGDWCSTIAEEYGFGWEIQLTENNLFFRFVTGTDRHSTVEFSPEFDNLKNAVYTRNLINYRNSGLAVGSGELFDQVCVDIGNSSGAGRYEEFISTGLSQDDETTAAQYRKQIKQAGSSEITKLKKRASISGEVDTDGIYKINQDFFMGDIVTVKTDQAITATTRLIEIIEAEETDGSHTIGTFAEWEV